MKWKTDYYESKRGSDGRFHFIYKITNNLNGKFYIGVHNTNDLGDGYRGSGDIIKKAYKKYGKKNFNYEILHFFQTEEETYIEESKIVNESLVQNPMCYNIILGGRGGKSGYLPMRNIDTGKVEVINVYNKPDNYESVNLGSIPVYDNSKNKYVRIPASEFDESIHTPMHKGKIVLYNTSKNIYEQVDVDDPRRETGELVSGSKNKVTVTDGKNNFQVDKNHPDYINGKLKIVTKDKWVLRNKITKKCISVQKNSEVDWNIYEYATCRPKISDDPNLVYARLIGEKKYKYYDKNDERLNTGDLLLHMPKNKRNICVTNGSIEIFLHESELDNFFNHHQNWYYGHKKYNRDENNSRKYKQWINNGVVNKIIHKDQIDQFLNDNPEWKRGCLIKK